MKICFTGDLFLGGDLCKKNVSKSILHPLFVYADKRVVNLEQPISDNDYIEDKCTLYTDSEVIPFLKEMKINAVNLAHNHIQDKGSDGIAETIFHLKKAEIACFGAGSTLEDARNPVWINDGLALFGYCEYDKPYLKQIIVAQDDNPGIAPLRYDIIKEDLKILPKDKKAILFFHWGREHVWFPPYEDIALAKKLLDDERVALIVGSHAHRAQGFIDHKGKRAYMCLGNFLFPNFYISPPTKICYPEKIPKKLMTTRQYHSVSELTYKKWKLINRISILLKYDSDDGAVSHCFGMQADNSPVVTELIGYKAKILDSFLTLVSFLYKTPKFIYLPIEKTSTLITSNIWKAKIIFFHAKQRGVLWLFSKVLSKISLKKL